MPSARTSLHERYELKDVLGRGGMGVVYRALDTLMNREVALKTILDVENTAAMEFFYSEWSVLATMVHPNVIGIYDIGEFEQDGARKPFFVMPLLPGATLDKLIRARSPRLTVDNVVSIVEQAARGLHAAHERGLVHRDVKPSNIFVMDDDSVKVIDFGIARQSSGRSVTTLRGTPWYFAPEQLEFKAPTPLSDLFALAVVAYETLTLRRPFQGASEDEVLNAIRRHNPPPVSDLNPNAPFQLSQVVHKALAKHPYHRFPTVREFGDALQKALRNEPLEYFDSSKVTPRLEKARQSFEQGEYEFASEILSELEAEGHLDTGIGLLRGRMDQAMRKVRIHQSLKSARRFVEASEYTLALRKVQEALDLDPEDADALSLHVHVEKERREKKIEEWLQLGRKHMENNAFRQAREAIDNAVRLKPNETEALELLAELGRREQEVARKRDDKSRLFQAARQAWEHGEVTSALSKLEVLIEIERGLPETDASRSTAYQNFYNQVRSEHDAIKNSYEEARRDLAADRLEAALSICRQQLAKYPNHALFTALQFDVEERRRQNLSGVIAETDRAVEQEPDLERRMGILEEALSRYPGEPHFEGALHLVRDKRDLVNSIVSKARFYEERNQFSEALDQWQILRSIHERHPGLSFEIERLMRRRDQQAREDARTRWVEQTDAALEAGDYARARQNVQGALAEFPGESDLLELEKLVGKREAHAAEAAKLLACARELSESGDLAGSLAPLRDGCKLDPRNTVIRAVLVNSLTETCRRQIAQADWDGAAGTVRELLSLQPGHSVAQGLADQIEEHKRSEYISSCAARARRLQTEGDIAGALAAVAEGIAAHPSDQRLLALRATLERAQAENQPIQTHSEESQEAPALAAAAAAGAEGAAPVPQFAAPPTQDVDRGPQAPETADAPATEPMDALMAQVFAPMTAETSAVPPAMDPVPTPPPAPRSAEPEGAPQLPEPQVAAAPPPATALTPETASAPTKEAAVNRRVNPRLLYGGIGAAGFIILLIASLGTARLFRFDRSGDDAGPHRVTLRASVAGAAISVNNKPCGATACEAQLSPGAYIAEARMEGYQTAISTFTVSATDSSPAEIRLQMEPSPISVNFVTDLTEGALLLDGAPAGQIQGGELAWPRLKPGSHVLAVESADAGVTLSLQTPPGAMPSLTRPIEARNARTVLVLRHGSSAHVHTTAKNLSAALDGAPAQPIPEAGLEIVGLSPGLHELAVMGAGPTRKLMFESAGAGAVYVAVFLDRKSGTARTGN